MIRTDLPLRVAYTDGAASGMVGPGGWAYELDGELVSGGFIGVTNNEMEMFAIFRLVEDCPPHSNLLIHTDSKLSINFLAKNYKPRTNPELQRLKDWIKRISFMKKIELNFVKVKAHNGAATDPGNMRVDRAAYSEAQRLKRKLEIQRERMMA
jgi:ribonuclease HI